MSGELEDEYAALMMTLTLYASPSLAEAYADESHSDLTKLANTIKSGKKWKKCCGAVSG